jgi:hypothetical protein
MREGQGQVERQIQTTFERQGGRFESILQERDAKWSKRVEAQQAVIQDFERAFPRF